MILVSMIAAVHSFLLPAVVPPSLSPEIDIAVAVAAAAVVQTTS